MVFGLFSDFFQLFPLFRLNRGWNTLSSPWHAKQRFAQERERHHDEERAPDFAGEARIVFDLVFDDMIIESGKQLRERGFAQRFGMIFTQRSIQRDEPVPIFDDPRAQRLL